MSNEHGEQAREIVRVEQRTQTDCLRCCLAMVTAIDYDDVPDFVADHEESWPTACEAWLSGLGMGLLMMSAAPAWAPPWLPIIARGPTARMGQFSVAGVRRTYHIHRAVLPPALSTRKFKGSNDQVSSNSRTN